jgi:hypothetical protein
MGSTGKRDFIEKSVGFQSVAIRSWREQAKSLTKGAFIVSDPQMRRSLRKERALAGRAGYDLNRHIRLLLQRKTTAAK